MKAHLKSNSICVCNPPSVRIVEMDTQPFQSAECTLWTWNLDVVGMWRLQIKLKNKVIQISYVLCIVLYIYLNNEWIFSLYFKVSHYSITIQWWIHIAVGSGVFSLNIYFVWFMYDPLVQCLITLWPGEYTDGKSRYNSIEMWRFSSTHLIIGLDFTCSFP